MSDFQLHEDRLVQAYQLSLKSGEETFADVPISLRDKNGSIDFQLISKKYDIPLDRMSNHWSARIRFEGKTPVEKPSVTKWS